MNTIHHHSIGSNTDIVGTIPTEIGLLTKLTQLDIGKCFIDTDIPSEIWLLTGLRKLNLCKLCNFILYRRIISFSRTINPVTSKINKWFLLTLLPLDSFRPLG